MRGMRISWVEYWGVPEVLWMVNGTDPPPGFKSSLGCRSLSLTTYADCSNTSHWPPFLKVMKM